MKRLRQVCLVAHELAPAIADLRAVLGLGEGFADEGVGLFGLENSVVPVGDQFLEIVSPTQQGTTAGRFLERRGGDGGYMAIFQTDDLGADRERLEAMSVRVVWDVTLPDIAAVHLHPRDVGAAIVSFDQPAPPESWKWGGPEWQGRARSDGAIEIRGVEIQAADAQAMADRWQAVLGLDAPRSEGDARILDLTDGFVRFVPSRDDRGDGLRGVTLRTTSRSRALEEAARRHVREEDGHLELCGTWIELVE